jgi:hypothetical protein
MEDLGFRKRSGRIFTIPVSDGMMGWVGLATSVGGRPKGQRGVSPTVGLRHHEVERIVAELLGEKFAPDQPTVSHPLGYLMPERSNIQWEFGRADDQSEARSMVGAIRAYGLPFIWDHADLDRLCALIDTGIGFEHQLQFSRPVANWLAGRQARAIELVDATLIDQGSRTDPAAVQFRDFAVVLRERIGAVGSRLPAIAAERPSGPQRLAVSSAGESLWLEPAGEPGAEPGMTVVTSPSSLAEDLRAYGEDEVAERVRRFTPVELARVSRLASGYALRTVGKNERGMLLAMALAMAAVEVAEGSPRPLKRNRRSSMPKTW